MLENKPQKIKVLIASYLAFSILLGVVSASWEKAQYTKFIHQIEEQKSRPAYIEGSKDMIYATNKDFTRYTRWAYYRSYGDNEQLCYDKTHSFLFRPYKTFAQNVNLSKVERDHFETLYMNFIGSALVSNFLILVLIIPFFFLWNFLAKSS